MKKGPLISIIIPAFNAADYLSATLNSALKQSYDNLEIILVNNGSTDSTDQVTASFKDDRLHYFEMDNNGAAAARNFGFSVCKGKYIQYLDADDILHTTKIEQQMALMLEKSVDISFALWNDFEDKIEENGTFQFKNLNYDRQRSGKELIRSFGMDHWFIPVFSWLCKRELIKQAGSWNENLTNNDDGEFFYRVLVNAEKVVCLNEIRGYYRRTANPSLSAFDSEKKVNSAYLSAKLIEDQIRGSGQLDLLCYPKRQYYIQFRMFKRHYPKLAKRSAKAFDEIDSDCYLIEKKRFWRCIQTFGLEKGVWVYKRFLKGSNIFRKFF